MNGYGVRQVTVVGRLEEVTLRVAPGSITAVVGGDGAGKSTLMRVLAGALAPDSGEVRTPPRENIGFVPTNAGSYPDLTVQENLRFVATAYGLSSAELTRAGVRVLHLTGLEDARGRLASQLSGGMRQKLAFALATVHRPELLVLDEPTTGVDPVSRVELWRMIAGAAAEGVHVVVATSYIDEAERATEVLALQDGRALLQGSPARLLDQVPGTVAELAAPVERSRAWRRGNRWHEWMPPGSDRGPGEPVEPDLEDAVLVASLRGEERA